MPRTQLGDTLRVLRAVLRSRTLGRVMLAFLLFAGVEYGSWVAILLWAYDVLGPESVGVVAVVQLVPSAVFTAGATSIADRFARQHVLLASYLLQAAALGITAVAMFLAWPPEAVLAAAIVAACGITITRPAHWALVPMLARTPEELTAANGVAGSVEGMGRVAGPLAAAVVLAFGPPSAVFAVSAIAAGVAAALVVRLRVHGGGHVVHAHPADDRDGEREHVATDIPVVEPPTPRSSQLAGAVRALGGGRDARVIVLLIAAWAFVIGCTDVLFVLFALDVLGIGQSGASVLSAALGLGWVVGGVAAFSLVGRRRLAPVLGLGAAFLGGACVALGIAPSALIAVGLIVIGGVGASTLDIASRTVLQRVVDPRALTRALGVLEAVSILTMAAGSLVAPVIATVWSVPAALGVAGLVMLVAIAVAWLPLGDIDRRVRVPVRELALLRFDRILSLLPAPKLETVASAGRWLTLDRGEVLIHEGDVGDRYYVLESGALRISQHGRVLHDAESERGYGLGEIALLRDVARTATATATEPSVLLAIARADFLEAVTGSEQSGSAARRTADAREPVAGGA